MQNNKLYTVSEFAKLVGVPYQVIYQGIRRGDIKKEIILDHNNKFRYRIPHSELDKFAISIMDNIIDSLNLIINGFIH